MRAKRYFILRGLMLALLGIATAIPTASVASQIGIYVDQSGSSCSFSGNAPGVVTAYIVVKPDANGVLGVRFAAPVPSCFGGVFMYESVPDGASMIGDSQTGVSVAFPFCAIEGAPAVVLQVNYFRSGSTAPCCEFPVVADPFVGSLEATDCSFQSATLTPLTSHFNADSSCPCADSQPPQPPTTPSPADMGEMVSVTTSLGWVPSPLDGDIVSYDVYLGTSPTPGLEATVTQPTYQPPLPLFELTPYYWRVVVRDVDGLTTSGPTWTFTTRATNSPPDQPVWVYPSDGDTGIPLNIALQWNGRDIDDDPLSYDVYFGTAASPPLVASAWTSTTYVLPALAYSTTYRWKIVAHDPLGHATAGPVWTFTTRPANLPPGVPNTPNLNQVTNAPYHNLTLTWNATDPDGDALTFDVYFGPCSGPSGCPPASLPLVASDVATKSYGPLELNRQSSYSWQIVARDSHGAQTSGPKWLFTTTLGSAPTVTYLTPPNFEYFVSATPMLSWQGHDADGDQLYYDVWMGTSPGSLTRVANKITTSFFSAGPLEFGTRYYWQLSVFDDPNYTGWSYGQWTFVTTPNVTGAGDVPVKLELGRNHPNPFNPQTIIPYGIPAGGGRVRLVIYDASGRAVRVLVDEKQTSGVREVIWNGADDAGATVSSGIYFCVLQVGDERRTQKLVLLK